MNIFVIYSTDSFFISFLMNEKRYRKGFLTNLTIHGDEFMMPNLYYEDYDKRIDISDNEHWIFPKFYKWLKKEKWNKLKKQIDNDLVFSRLKQERNELLKLLKYIKKEFNLKKQIN